MPDNQKLHINVFIKPGLWICQTRIYIYIYLFYTFQTFPTFLSSYYHGIFIVITIEEYGAHAKREDQRPKVKVTEVKANLAPIWAFLDRRSSLNSQIATKWYTKLEKVAFLWRPSVKFQALTGWKFDDFAPIGAFPDNNFNLNWQMALHRFPIIFRGHPSNFTQADKSTFLTRFE